MLARYLDRDRYEQRILVRRCSGDLPRLLRDEGVEIIETGEGRLFEPRIMLKAIREAWVFKPHVVHGAVFEGVATAVVAGRACGAKVVVEETSHATNRSKRGHALFRGLATLSDKCVAISPAVGDYLVDVTGVPRGKVRVITNGVFSPLVPDVERSELRRAWEVPEDAFVVGTVCRLVDDSHKRVSDLLRTLVLLADLPEVHLLVVGDGPERSRLEGLASDLGVRARVTFIGQREDVGAAYKIMDVFSLASSREGFGLVVAEAMMAGVPVVATRVGGICDIVDDRTGRLVPPCDPPSLATEIRLLHARPDERLAMGRAGYERARSRFGAQRYAKDVDTLYREITGGGN